MGARTNGGSGIKVWYVSELPNWQAKRYLEERGWEIKLAETMDQFSLMLEKEAYPEVILLGGATRDGGFTDVLDELKSRRLERREWRVIPFSSDIMINGYMREIGPKLAEDGVRVIDMLGDLPHQGVFDEGRIQALETGIREARSGIEGGAAGDARRK